MGQAILESYSRVIESLAFNMMSRIEDVLYADTMVRESKMEESFENLSDTDKLSSDENFVDKTSSNENDSAASKTLLDFMGWNINRGSFYIRSLVTKENYNKEEDDKLMSKPASFVTAKRFSYLEKLESLSALRSPTARH